MAFMAKFEDEKTDFSLNCQKTNIEVSQPFCENILYGQDALLLSDKTNIVNNLFMVVVVLWSCFVMNSVIFRKKNPEIQNVRLVCVL